MQSFVRLRAFSRRSVTIGIAALAMSLAYTSPIAAQVVGAPGTTRRPVQLSPDVERWRAEMIRRPPPKKGCFKAQPPRSEWIETTCVEPPNLPYPPAHGPRPFTVGGANDFSAQVSGTLFSVEGSYDSVSGVTSIMGQESGSGPDVADTYSLQLNTEPFDTPVCDASPNPSCLGWQQFLYSATAGRIFIQYWLLRYNTTCPAGWNTFMFPSSTDIYCFRNGPSSTFVGRQSAANLVNLQLGGAANVAGTDVVTMSTDGGATLSMAANAADILSLSASWTGAEFILVGDCCGTEAKFNAGSTITVRTTVHNGTRDAPMCVLNGFTGETNNLNLVGTPPVGIGPSPAIVSQQSNTLDTPASCASASGRGDPHLTTFSGLMYDFQASGEFILAETGSEFVVQARQVSGAPVWPNASVNSAVAVRAGKTRVALCLPGRVEVDGKPLSVPDGAAIRLAEGVDIQRRGSLYAIRGPEGDSVSARVHSGWIDVTVGLGRWPSDVRGLLANPHGDIGLLETREGEILSEPLSFKEFYGKYGDSWRVRAGESILCGKDVAPSNPSSSLTVRDLDPKRAKQARAVCAKAGVAEGPLLDACILDVVVIGRPEAADAFVGIAAPVAVAIH